MLKHLALFILFVVAPGCAIDTTTVSSAEAELAFDIAEPAPEPPAGRSFSCLTKEGSTCKASCDLTKTINGKQCSLEELHTAGANSPARQCYYEPAAPSISCYYACDDQIGLERVLVGCAVDAGDGFDALALPLDDLP